MIIVITLLVGVLTFLFNKSIRKQSVLFGLLAVVLAVVGYILDFELVTKGILGFSIYILVMFAGAFKPSSTIAKRFKSIRKELSIGGFILLVPHFYKYIIQFMTGERSWEWYGVVAAVIMVPLFVMSFKKVKEKFTYSKWKHYQRYSYIVYVLTFVHVIILGGAENKIIYSILFVTYAALKYINFFRTETGWKHNLSLLVVVFAAVFSIGNNLIANQHQYRGSITLTEEVDMSKVPDGTYKGTAQGFEEYKVTLNIQVENHDITDIKIIDNGSTRPHDGIDFAKAVEEVTTKIVTDHTITIDVVSGATTSTSGAMDAVVNALEEFKIESTD